MQHMIIYSKSYRYTKYMKQKDKKSAKSNIIVREEILHSMVESFRIEGIHIPEALALASLKKVQITLGK